MVEFVQSALVGEVVSQLSSNIASKYEEHTTKQEHVERIEMAVLKVQSGLEICEGWQIMQPSLLRWRDKLKRVSEEGDEILRAHKKRVLENKANDEAASGSSVRRLARAVNRHFFPFLASTTTTTTSHEGLSTSAVQRFERLANGVIEFVRLVECGGRAKRFMFFQPLTGHLLAGKEASCSLRMENGVGNFSLRPCMRNPERGPHAALYFIYEDEGHWDKNFILHVFVRLSENTDVVGVATKCLRFFPSQFKSISNAMEREFCGLSLQDMTCVPSSADSEWAKWYDQHIRLYCPNPECGKSSSPCNIIDTACSLESLESIPEPVISIGVQCFISQNNTSLLRSIGVANYKYFGKNSLASIRLYYIIGPHFTYELLQFPSSSCTVEDLTVVGGVEQQNGKHEHVGVHVLGPVLSKGIGRVNSEAAVIEHKAPWYFTHGRVALAVKSKGDKNLDEQNYLELERIKRLLQEGKVGTREDHKDVA